MNDFDKAIVFYDKAILYNQYLFVEPYVRKCEI